MSHTIRATVSWLVGLTFVFGGAFVAETLIVPNEGLTGTGWVILSSIFCVIVGGISMETQAEYEKRHRRNQIREGDGW